MVEEKEVWQALQQVNDPEYPLSIVDLGMVYDIAVNRGHVQIEITFTAMGCPATEMIISDVREAAAKVRGVTGVDVDVVWNPPWTKDNITSRGREILQYYGVGI